MCVNNIQYKTLTEDMTAYKVVRRSRDRKKYISWLKPSHRADQWDAEGIRRFIGIMASTAWTRFSGPTLTYEIGKTKRTRTGVGMFAFLRPCHVSQYHPGAPGNGYMDYYSHPKAVLEVRIPAGTRVALGDAGMNRQDSVLTPVLHIVRELAYDDIVALKRDAA